MLRGLFLTIVLCLALALAGCGGGDDSTSTGAAGTDASPSPSTESETTATKPKVKVPSGPPPKQLQSTDLVEGEGAEAKAGDEVTVQYVGVNYKTGKEFDASWDGGAPFTFPLGVGEVIAGWDQGVEGMKVGGRRQLTIPPELGYGPGGYPPAIPPNETLVFVIDLVAVS